MHGWYEAPEDEELTPGDLGGGVSDLEAGAYLSPRRVRRVPLSFTAVVLLLTLTTGIGMSAGLLTGPNPWHLLPALGHSATENGTAPGSGHSSSPGPNGTKSPQNNTVPGNSTSNSTGGHSGDNSTGGHSGGNQSGNDTGGKGSGGHGNSTGTGGQNTTGNSGSTNGTGNGTGPHSNPNGPGGGSGTNGTSPRNGSTNRSVIVYRTILPWLPELHPNLVLIAVGVCLFGLGAAVLAESIRPPPDRGNPWRGQIATPKRARPRRRPVSPREALDLAVKKLREELHAYTLRFGTMGDALVRERIIQLYGALLAAFAPGLGDLDGRTPREVEWLAVRYLGVRQATAHELTWLFEEARYSTHPLPPEGIQRAEKALAALMTDLEGQRLWN